MTQIPRRRQRLSGGWDIAEPACWNDWYAQFDAEWRSRWEAKLAGRWSIEEFERLIKPALKTSQATVELMEQASDADVLWLSAALQHDRRKWFVASVAAGARVLPEALFEPMLLAGIEEVSPDFNRRFIEPFCAPSAIGR